MLTIPLSILLTGCRLHVPPTPISPISSGDVTDRIAAREEAAVMLSNYIMVDTINPPGNELSGAEYLSGVLTAEGIPHEIDEFLPGRANLIARLEGQGSGPPLCLLSHSDVVTAEAEKWDEDRQPLSGARADGYVWAASPGRAPEPGHRAAGGGGRGGRGTGHPARGGDVG